MTESTPDARPQHYASYQDLIGSEINRLLDGSLPLMPGSDTDPDLDAYYPVIPEYVLAELTALNEWVENQRRQIVETSSQSNVYRIPLPPPEPTSQSAASTQGAQTGQYDDGQTDRFAAVSRGEDGPHADGDSNGILGFQAEPDDPAVPADTWQAEDDKRRAEAAQIQLPSFGQQPPPTGRTRTPPTKGPSLLTRAWKSL